jgi:hypothetical protein
LPANTPLKPFTEIGTVTLFTEVGSIASLKVSTIGLFTETEVAEFIGLTLTTVGSVVFGAPDVPVVKLLVNGTTAFPDWSINPLAVTLYVVLTASKFVGTNATKVPLLLTLIVPGTEMPPEATTTALLPTLGALNGALISKSTRTFAGTLFVPFAGLTIRTVGADVLLAEPVVKLELKLERAWPSISVMPNVADTK